MSGVGACRPAAVALTELERHAGRGLTSVETLRAESKRLRAGTEALLDRIEASFRTSRAAASSPLEARPGRARGRRQEIAQRSGPALQLTSAFGSGKRGECLCCPAGCRFVWAAVLWAACAVPAPDVLPLRPSSPSGTPRTGSTAAESSTTWTSTDFVRGIAHDACGQHDRDQQDDFDTHEGDGYSDERHPSDQHDGDMQQADWRRDGARQHSFDTHDWGDQCGMQKAPLQQFRGQHHDFDAHEEDEDESRATEGHDGDLQQIDGQHDGELQHFQQYVGNQPYGTKLYFGGCHDGGDAHVAGGAVLPLPPPQLRRQRFRGLLHGG
ncbi:unnamed protein product [Prorocentrum cordatum]|uniref:Uncharacterized protein n=1 Tax=Prorocentrum cordatum TaxID=2364126 RepID=A0ABN9UPH9_9DINO|nr:unnamed protein product [Polarella glacialis]